MLFNIQSFPIKSVLYDTLDQYVDRMKNESQSNRPIAARMMSLALPLFELKAGLSYGMSAMIRIPFAGINLGSILTLMVFDMNSPTSKIGLIVYNATPSLSQIIRLACKTMVCAIGVILGPLIGLASPDLFFKYHQLIQFNEGAGKKENEKKPDPVPLETGPKGFEAIVGMDQVKAEMQHAINILQYPTIAEKYGVGLPSGSLFYGPPGCGKSFFAKKMSEEIEKQTGKKVSYYQLSAGQIKSQFIHQSTKQIAAIFEEAAKEAQLKKSISVIVIDEIDTIIPSGNADGGLRSSADQSYSEERGEFLHQLEKAAERNIFVIGTTNYLGKIDPAVLRPGRFDNKIEITQPDQEMRLSLIKEFFHNRPVEKSVNFSKLAEKLNGCSVAEIKFFVEAVCHTAMAKTLAAQVENSNGEIQEINQEIIDSIQRTTVELR